MIISASRRTDVPAFYTPWFLNRIRAGEVMVRNPFDNRRISRVSLRREHVDFIQFWTKNPRPILRRLAELDGYQYAFHYTVNGYGPALEPHVPELSPIFKTFAELSRRCGPERVQWRYSPIVIGDGFGVDFHLDNFTSIASQLKGLTHRCYISLLDEYPKIRKTISDRCIRTPDPALQREILTALPDIARDYGITLYSCAEESWREPYGIVPGQCLDPSVLGRDLNTYKKDPGQRRECMCSQSVDIGGYGSCPHDCVYCYANRTGPNPAREYERHDPLSPLITGNLSPGDIVTEHFLSRKAVKSMGGSGTTLFG